MHHGQRKSASKPGSKIEGESPPRKDKKFYAKYDIFLNSMAKADSQSLETKMTEKPLTVPVIKSWSMAAGITLSFRRALNRTSVPALIFRSQYKSSLKRD